MEMRIHVRKSNGWKGKIVFHFYWVHFFPLQSGLVFRFQLEFFLWTERLMKTSSLYPVPLLCMQIMLENGVFARCKWRLGVVQLGCVQYYFLKKILCERKLLFTFTMAYLKIICFLITQATVTQSLSRKHVAWLLLTLEYCCSFTSHCSVRTVNNSSIGALMRSIPPSSSLDGRSSSIEYSCVENRQIETSESRFWPSISNYKNVCPGIFKWDR